MTGRIEMSGDIWTASWIERGDEAPVWPQLSETLVIALKGRTAPLVEWLEARGDGGKLFCQSELWTIVTSELLREFLFDGMSASTGLSGRSIMCIRGPHAPCVSIKEEKMWFQMSTREIIEQTEDARWCRINQRCPHALAIRHWCFLFLYSARWRDFLKVRKFLSMSKLLCLCGVHSLESDVQMYLRIGKSRQTRWRLYLSRDKVNGKKRSKVFRCTRTSSTQVHEAWRGRRGRKKKEEKWCQSHFLFLLAVHRVAFGVASYFSITSFKSTARHSLERERVSCRGRLNVKRSNSDDSVHVWLCNASDWKGRFITLHLSRALCVSVDHVIALSRVIEVDLVLSLLTFLLVSLTLFTCCCWMLFICVRKHVLWKGEVFSSPHKWPVKQMVSVKNVVNTLHTVI